MISVSSHISSSSNRGVAKNPQTKLALQLQLRTPHQRDNHKKETVEELEEEGEELETMHGSSPNYNKSPTDSPLSTQTMASPTSVTQLRLPPTPKGACGSSITPTSSDTYKSRSKNRRLVPPDFSLLLMKEEEGGEGINTTPTASARETLASTITGVLQELVEDELDKEEVTPTPPTNVELEDLERHCQHDMQCLTESLHSAFHPELLLPATGESKDEDTTTMGELDKETLDSNPLLVATSTYETDCDDSDDEDGDSPDSIRELQAMLLDMERQVTESFRSNSTTSSDAIFLDHDYPSSDVDKTSDDDDDAGKEAIHGEMAFQQCKAKSITHNKNMQFDHENAHGLKPNSPAAPFTMVDSASSWASTTTAELLTAAKVNTNSGPEQCHVVPDDDGDVRTQANNNNTISSLTESPTLPSTKEHSTTVAATKGLAGAAVVAVASYSVLAFSSGASSFFLTNLYQ